MEAHPPMRRPDGVFDNAGGAFLCPQLGIILQREHRVGLRN